MESLRDALLRSGLASQEQVQKAEADKAAEAANREAEAKRVEGLRRFEQTGRLRDFVEAYPEFKGYIPCPPDTPVHEYKYLEDMRLHVQNPRRARELETGYGSPYVGTILVVRVEQDGTANRNWVQLTDDGKLAGQLGESRVRAKRLLVVEQHLRDVTIYVRLD